MKNIKIIKFIIIGAFLFLLAYINKERIPVPVELKTFDFIMSSGIDIIISDNAGSSNDNSVSVSYISSEDINQESEKPNANKNIFNVKAATFNKATEQLQSLTNKSLNDSHLEYILIGEATAKENLGYLIKHYSKSPSVRLDASMFVTKDMTSEKFIEKILTSEVDVNARINTLLNDKTQISSTIKKNLKDLLQIFYSKDKTGLIPVLETVESPIKNVDENSDDSNNSDDTHSNDSDNTDNTESSDESSEKKYTFRFYGLGIIKDGKLTDYLESSLVRSYIVLTKNLRCTDIEIIDEKGDLSAFPVKSSQNKISFAFDGENPNKPSKVIFNINIDTNFDETTAAEKILTDENIPILNEYQSEVIKSEIEKIIEKSKETGADFLNIGRTFSIQHPYKWHFIEKDWNNIFKNLDCEINVETRIKRYYNINSYETIG